MGNVEFGCCSSRDKEDFGDADKCLPALPRVLLDEVASAPVASVQQEEELDNQGDSHVPPDNETCTIRLVDETRKEDESPDTELVNKSTAPTKTLLEDRRRERRECLQASAKAALVELGTPGRKRERTCSDKVEKSDLHSTSRSNLKVLVTSVGGATESNVKAEPECEPSARRASKKVKTRYFPELKGLKDQLEYEVLQRYEEDRLSLYSADHAAYFTGNDLETECARFGQISTRELHESWRELNSRLIKCPAEQVLVNMGTAC
mmetsp:Transcript_35393/g.94238  ORF Transcript_35393/g.94238 Transcript_35393/m.94238 type:complete len:264 (-) Transcript_35393:31-822(-)